MELRKSTKLPEGVGKKIIDALRNQSKVTPEIVENKSKTSFEKYLEESEDYESLEIVDSETVDQQVEEFDLEEQDQEDLSYYENAEEQEIEQEIEEDIYSDLDVDDEDQEIEKDQQEEPEIEANYDNEEEIEEEIIEEQVYIKPPVKKIITKKCEAVQKVKPVEELMPKSSFSTPQKSSNSSSNESSIGVLMRLVSQLPQGVTKQTGAQIIRQTMEAMGISVNKVVSEAQQIQDEFSQSISTNLNTIDQYKNNIKSLEKEVHKYRKKAEELEELIGLFIAR